MKTDDPAGYGAILSRDEGGFAARRPAHGRLHIELRPQDGDESYLFHGPAKGAGLAAEMARGSGKPRVYLVEPTGEYENDPNVTDKKYPGNPTRSYRSRQPLKVVGEIETWELFDAEFIRVLRARIATGMGEIIN